MSDPHLDEDQAIAIAMGQPPEPQERAHLDLCEACRARVEALRAIADEGQRALVALDEVAPLSPEASRRVLERVRTEAQAAARWPAALLVGGICVAAVGLAAREAPAHAISALALPALTLGAAVVVGALATTRSAGGAALVSVAMSLALGVLDAHEAGGLHADLGVRCLGIELVLAGLAAMIVHVGGVAQKRPAVLAAAAGAGALAGQAGLMVTCHAPGSLVHGLVFHTLGVLAAVALAHSTRWLRLA